MALNYNKTAKFLQSLVLVMLLVIETEAHFLF